MGVFIIRMYLYSPDTKLLDDSRVGKSSEILSVQSHIIHSIGGSVWNRINTEVSPPVWSGEYQHWLSCFNLDITLVVLMEVSQRTINFYTKFLSFVHFITYAGYTGLNLRTRYTPLPVRFQQSLLALRYRVDYWR